MATHKAILLRQNAARTRIADAVTALAGAVGVVLPDLVPRHRDTGIEQTLRLEALAGGLEGVAAALPRRDAQMIERVRAETVAELGEKGATTEEPETPPAAQPDPGPVVDAAPASKTGKRREP